MKLRLRTKKYLIWRCKIWIYLTVVSDTGKWDEMAFQPWTITVKYFYNLYGGISWAMPTYRILKGSLQSRRISNDHFWGTCRKRLTSSSFCRHNLNIYVRQRRVPCISGRSDGRRATEEPLACIKKINSVACVGKRTGQTRCKGIVVLSKN